MKVGIITCMASMFALSLTVGAPNRSQTSLSEETVPIGGKVTLLCSFNPDDLWKWVYWKKNDHTIYSLEVKSNTPWTNDTRYVGSDHATRLTIKDLKKADSGIYNCEVETLVVIKKGGRVLLSVTDQEVGPSTTSPGVPLRASTKIPPQPAGDNNMSLVFLIFIPFTCIPVCLVYKYWKRILNFPTELDSASSRPPFSLQPQMRARQRQCKQLEGADTPLLYDENVQGKKNNASLPLIFNDPIHGSVQMPRHCQIIIDTPEFQRLRFIKQLGCTCYVFPSAVHTRFEHSIGVSHLGGKLASILQQNDRNSSTPIQNTEVACVEIAGLCHALGHGPFSHAFEDIVPPDKDGKKWKHEEQSVIMLKYLIEHNSLEKKLQEHNIYDKEIDFICQLILGVKKDEKMLRENKFCLYQIVNNSVNGDYVNTWDYLARDTHYLGMKSAFDFNRILPFVEVFKVKRGSKTTRELCFRDKVASDLNHMFLTRRRLHYTSYQHRVSKIVTTMLKDAFQEAADHLLFVGAGGKEYNLLESVRDPEAFCQVNDTIVNDIMRSQSQEPGMVKAREIIDRIHKRELYQCIAECQRANEEMETIDPAVIKQLILNDFDEHSSTSSSSSSEIWQAHNIEVEVSHFNYGSGDSNPLLDILFYKKSSDGKFDAELLPEYKIPADLPQRLLDVTLRIYTKVPKLGRETINNARSRCKERLKTIQQKVMSPPISPLTSPRSGSGSTKDLQAGFVSTFNKLVFNDPIHSSVQISKHCQIVIDTPEFQRLRFIKQLGCTCYVFPSAVHTRFEHSIGVSHLARKLASMLQQNDSNIQDTEVACVEIAGLCHDLGHGPFSHAFEDIVPPDKDGKNWKHEQQSVIMFKYLIKQNSLEKKLEEHNIYAEEIDFICQLILGVNEDEEMLRENKFYLYQIVNNSVNGVDVDKWDYFARDTYYLGMKSAFDFNRILPFVKVFDVKRGSKTMRELCFRDKIASDLNHMFLTRRRLHYAAYQHRVGKVITIMLKDAFQEAADHLLFVGKGGKKYNLLESVKDPKAFCQVNDTIVNEIMRSRSQEPGMVKAREIIDRIHKREFYQCIAECQHANEEMDTVDPAKIKRFIITPDTKHLSPSSSSSSEIWQARNIEVEVSHFDYGSGDSNPLLDIPFYKKSSDGQVDVEFLPEDKLPADLSQRLLDVTLRIYTKVSHLDRETINKARSRCKTRLASSGLMISRRRRTVPTTPVKQKVESPPVGPRAPILPISPVNPLTSPSSGSGSFVSSDGDAGISSLTSNPPDVAAVGTWSAESNPRGSRSPEPEVKGNRSNISH